MRRDESVLGLAVFLVVLMSALDAAHEANAQTSSFTPRLVRRFNGIDAGEEAYLIHENQRRGAITAQMALNDNMQMLRGLPPRYFEFFPANPFDANPCDALSPGPAVDAVWAMPYYPADPLGADGPTSGDATEVDTGDMEVIDDSAAAVDRLFEPPVPPTPRPPRAFNADARPAQQWPPLNRAGQPLRPEELPAPAEVRAQQRGGGPREF